MIDEKLLLKQLKARLKIFRQNLKQEIARSDNLEMRDGEDYKLYALRGRIAATEEAIQLINGLSK